MSPLTHHLFSSVPNGGRLVPFNSRDGARKLNNFTSKAKQTPKQNIDRHNFLSDQPRQPAILVLAEQRVKLSHLTFHVRVLKGGLLPRMADTGLHV